MTADSGPATARAARSLTPESSADAPRRILVAGDWHGNEDWALHVIRRVPGALAGEGRRLILQLGDFGVWPDRAGQQYLARISRALAEVDAELWFIDGNHEDFPQLARLAAEAATVDGRVLVRPHLMHLPRGYRWTWHGRTWLACGGGVSLDRAVRAQDVDWWPAEEITAAQEAAIIAGVMLTCWPVMNARPLSRMGSAGRRPAGRPRTWPVTTRTGGACSASWTQSSHRASCTGTCIAPTRGPAISVTARSR
jgi:Calcineurin-like phosphoesterase